MIIFNIVTATLIALILLKRIYLYLQDKESDILEMIFLVYILIEFIYVTHK